MLERKQLFFTKKIVLTIIMTILFSAFGFSQTVTGPTPVDENSTHTYQFDNGILYPVVNWVITGGTLVSSSSSSTTYSAVVQWGSAGAGSVTIRRRAIVINTLIVTINAAASSPPTILSDENYVYTLTPRIETTDASLLTNEEKIEAVDYFDGLGRLMQSIGIRAGNNEEDIITHTEYDNYSRQAKEFLPYSLSNNGGEYKTNALSATNTYYDDAKYEDDFPGISVNDINPYSEKLFEASPLNRVLQQAAPGEDWKLGNGHEIDIEYQTNTSNEIRKYDVSLSFVNNTYTPVLELNTAVNSGYYSAGELYKTITKDENHDGTSTKAHTTEEFKDAEGRVVLKRTYGTSIVNGLSQTNVAHDTYYVYDTYGNLTYVLPPKAEANGDIPNSTELDELCYQYKYDQRNRLVEKKIPGKGDANTLEEIVYNLLDQPVMTRDPNLKAQGKWLFTKYDAFGRVAYTGIKNSSNSRSYFQGVADNPSSYSQFEQKTSNYITVAGTTIYYTKTAIPKTMDEILTINYYDNYNWDIGSGVSETSYTVTPITNAKGLATGSKVRVLNSSPVKWITTVSYYDDKSRLIYVYSFNDYLGTTDKVKSKFDFVQVVETTTTHAKTGQSTITTVDAFTYDLAGRLATQTQIINGGSAELIVFNTYDELGQLVSKDVGNTTATPLQTIDYTYNVRGWLKQINDPNASLGTDLFAFQIYYNDPVQSFGTGLFNGNISETSWKTANDNTQFRYTYFYDALNRITKADFAGGGYWARYKLQEVKYDKNGNITVLRRAGHIVAQPDRTVASDFGNMDNLTYDYGIANGNQLYEVKDYEDDTYGFKDSTVDDQDYWYDANGNMTKDDNKGITDIDYNHLNLPTKVTLTSGYIDYIYDATGLKLKKIVSTGGTTEYAGNYIYKDNVLQFFNHPEGYVEPNGSNYDYVYQYKDHLGNIRLSYKDVNQNNPFPVSLEIQEENNYYPFGLKHKGYNGNIISEHPYKYNGKELNEELGLNWYDYGSRFYDAALSRFMTIDPKTIEFDFQSPYAYAVNNPIFFVDKDGEGPWPKATGIGIGINLRRIGRTFKYIAEGDSPAKAYAKASYDDLKEGAKQTARYATPIEDVYGAITGKDFDGQNYNRASASGWAIVGIVPGAKLGKLSKLLKLGNAKKFKKLGDVSKLEGAGSESLKKIVDKVNNIGGDHLKNSDLTGAILDISGNPVTIGGRTFDHLGEVKDAMKGLGNQLTKLNKLIDSGDLGENVIKAAKSLRTQLQNQKDQIQNVLNKAIDEVGN
jgi:RHS repeat-associated protein